MPWCVDDQQARKGQGGARRLAPGTVGAQHGGAADDGIGGDEGGPDLLRDAARLPLLHAGAPDVVQQLGLAGVDVAQDAADGGAQVGGVGPRLGRGPARGARGQRLTAGRGDASATEDVAPGLVAEMTYKQRHGNLLARR